MFQRHTVTKSLRKKHVKESRGQQNTDHHNGDIKRSKPLLMLNKNVRMTEIKSGLL